MAASLQPTSSKTSILDLNDDCLKGVFEHMGPKTLTAVADVCSRFKQNTMHAASRTFKEISLIGKTILIDGKPSEYGYSMLRNFGEFIETIHVYSYDVVEKRNIEYLSLYCVGKSIELRCGGFRITDEIAILMRPLLNRLQELRFGGCRFDKVLLRNLSSGLQESEYGANEPVNDREMQVDHLRPKNLKSILFRSEPNVKNVHIEEFLQKNPQLKEIEMVDCDCLDSRVFESIARNVSAIETITFVAYKRESSNRDDTKYFRQLRKLKSLTLGVDRNDSYVQPAVYEIASVNTGLEYLDLRHFDLRHNAKQFMGGISKLQQLKTFRLRDVKNFTAAHLIKISKHAKELSDISLENFAMKMTINDLLEIVKNATKLQEFMWIACRSPAETPANIDRSTFLKLAKLVDQRVEKTNLCMTLPGRLFASKIPHELLTAVDNLQIGFSPLWE